MIFQHVYYPRETDPYWSEEIRSDVIGECSQFGGVVHIFVDKEDPNGCVYLKAVNASIASACVNSLQCRWFSGDNFVFLMNAIE